MVTKISKKICAAVLLAGTALCASANPSYAFMGIMGDTPSGKDTLQHGIKITHAVLTPDNTGVYASGTFTLTNDSDTNRLLVNITSSACQKVVANRFGQNMVETMEDEKNIFSNLTIPHSSVIQFPRDGYHFVCRGFNNPQTQKVAFTFHFSEGDITVPFRLRS